MEQSLKIKLICLRILGIALRQLVRFLACEFGPQIVVDFFGNIFLDANQVRNFPVVLFSPYFRAIAYIHQIGLNSQSIATLRDLSQEDGVHLEVLPGFLRAHVVALVAEYCAACHYPQLRDSRETADDSIGYPISKVLETGIGADVRER